MWDFKLILVRVLLNLFVSQREFINNEINDAKSLGKNAKIPDLFYWCGVVFKLEFKDPHWVVSINVDDQVICQDKLTNGKWGFNRSTISRLESQFQKFDPNAAFIGFENYLFENINCDLDNEFTLVDRIFGKDKTKTIHTADDNFTIKLGNISRTVQGKYLIKNLTFYFPNDLTGVLEGIVPWNMKVVHSGLVFNDKETFKNFCIDKTVQELRSVLKWSLLN
ncbi:hypothetical protein [Aeromonas phage AerS_266]|nr:hypothetical protein [Aeromonas phage AerS_266]